MSFTKNERLMDLFARNVGGEFEYKERAFKRLIIIWPFTLIIIFVLIYLNTRSLVKTSIVLLHFRANSGSKISFLTCS